MVGIALHFLPIIKIVYAVQARAQKYNFGEDSRSSIYASSESVFSSSKEETNI